MSYGFIKLEWKVPKQGFRLEKRKTGIVGSTDDERKWTHLVPQGQAWRSYTVDLLEHLIFLKLATTPPDDEAILKFVNEWGLPTNDDWTVKRFTRLSLGLGKLALAADQRGIAELAKYYPSDKRFGSIKWGFRSIVGQSAPGICFYANNLLTFCWLELLQSCAGPTDFGQCEICKNLMQRPKAGPLPTYCSSACTQKAYRLRQKEIAAAAAKVANRRRDVPKHK